MSTIHPTAIVSKRSHIDPTAEIGPYVIIEDDVTVGADVKVLAHAFLCSGTTVGEGTQIHMGAVIGNLPQDLGFKNKKSFVKIGKRNIIREYVTIHRGTKEGTSTELGDENYLMVASHLGHNCTIGNKVILANGALLGGYVQVEDQAFLSGNVVVHQFCRIGKLAMIGGFSGVNQDVPPYVTVRGTSRVRSINIIGLRRAGFDRAALLEIKAAFRIIYRSGLNISQAIKKLEEQKHSAAVRDLIIFIKNSKRGICDYSLSPDDKKYLG
jgi:UDP-N-acetylglucosamine acyltransferase